MIKLDENTGVWASIISIAILIAGFFVKFGSKIQTVDDLEKSRDIHAKQIQEIKEDYISKDDLRDSQLMCQAHLWDKLMLALEKRDRDFDNKFSKICGGIQRIEEEVKRGR